MMGRDENTRFTAKRSWLALLVAMLAGIAHLAGCMEEVAGTGDETHTGISIAGRILDRDGNPFPGAAVTTVATGLADTTDASGRYHIQGRWTPNGGAVLARAASSPVETLLVTKDGKEIARLPVHAWVAYIADLQVARYSIRGKLQDRPVKSVAKARATVSAGAGVVRVVDLAYDSATLSFAGDFYLPVAGVPVAYSISVTVLGTDGQVVARAPAAVLDSRAPEVAIPTFPTVFTTLRGALRLVIAEVPMVYEGTMVTVGARAWWDGDPEPDSQDIASWEWKIGDQPWQRSAGAAWSTCDVTRQEPGEVPVAVRVRGADGQDALGAITVGFLPRNRLRISIAPLPDPLHPGDTLRIQAAATDSTPGSTTTMEWMSDDGNWTAVDTIPWIVLSPEDTGRAIAIRARSEAPDVWAGPSAHYQVSAETTLVVGVDPAPLPEEWNFEDEQGTPGAGFPDSASVFTLGGSSQDAQLHRNQIAPIDGFGDLEFRWTASDPSAGLPDGLAGRGFEMPIFRGFAVDLARQLASIELLLRKDLGGADLRIGLVSPDYPLGPADSGFARNLLGWGVRIGPGEIHSMSLDLDSAAFPADMATLPPSAGATAYDDAVRARVLARVTAVRITVVRAWTEDAEPDSGGVAAGALRLDNIRFVPADPR